MTFIRIVKSAARTWWGSDDGGEYGFSHQRDAYEQGFLRGWQQALLDAADFSDGKGLPDNLLAAALRDRARSLGESLP